MPRARFPIAECLQETPECLHKVTETEANVDTFKERSGDGTEARFNIMCRGSSRIFGTCTVAAVLHFYPDSSTDSFE